MVLSRFRIVLRTVAYVLFDTLTDCDFSAVLRKQHFLGVFLTVPLKNMFFDRFFPKLPTVKAQEEQEEAELVDPQQLLRTQCLEGSHCKHLAEKYQACNDRVNSKSQTTETCVEELFDLLHAVDHCVTADLFSKLK